MAANFPDADFLLGLLGPEAYLLWHRGLTHSLLGMPLFAGALAYLAHAALPGLPLRRALLLCAVGFASHALLDLPTAWGTLALYPLSHERFAWNWLFIVDPVLWGMLLGGVLAGAGRSEGLRRRAALAGVTIAVVYAAGAAGVHAAARAEAARAVAASGRAAPPRERVEVFPRPFSPWRWSAVVWSGDSLLQVPVQGFPPEAGEPLPLAHGLGSRPVADALRTPPGQAFLWWSEAPAGRVVAREPDRVVVRLGDLRYQVRDGPEDLFAMDVTLGAGGELVDARWEGEPVFESDRAR